jgi:hypothetical protein
MKFARVMRSTALLLIPALLSSSFAFAARPLTPPAVKTKLEARGLGHGIRVTLLSNGEAKGKIVSIGDQSFVLQAKGADAPQTIEYAQVTGVHNDKMSTGKKVLIGVVILGAAVGIVAAILIHSFNNSFPKSIPI